MKFQYPPDPLVTGSTIGETHERIVSGIRGSGRYAGTLSHEVEPVLHAALTQMSSAGEEKSRKSMRIAEKLILSRLDAMGVISIFGLSGLLWKIGFPILWYVIKAYIRRSLSHYFK